LERVVDLSPVEIKAFVPAADFALSKKFYLALGFEIPWSSDDLAYVRHESVSFLLQSYNQPDFAAHFMMSLQVNNVDDWYAHVLACGVVERFGIRIQPPQDQPWGMRDFPMSDPGGVLWRVAQNIPVETGS
jgi:hypothetical protein